MRTRLLGSSDLKVSVAGLGCNAFGRRIDQAQTERVVHAALDAGVTLFDTADIYSDGESETFLGAALGARRDQAIIATKFGGSMGEGRSGASRRWILEAVEDSLRRLGTDVIDLYQIHFPDDETPLEETMRALDELVRSGKVRHIGCSNFSGDQIVEAATISAEHGLMPFVSAQNHWSLVEREVELEVIPACERERLGVFPYFPLGGGLLTGKYRRHQPPPPGTRFAGDERFKDMLTDEKFDVVDRLETIAHEHGVTLLHVALGWLATHPVVASVISGATRPEQILANVEATLWEPDGATMAAISNAATSEFAT